MSSWEQTELRTSPMSDSQMGGRMCPTVNKGKSLSTVSGLTKLSYHMPELILCNSARLWQLCQVFMDVVRFDSAG